MVGALAGVTGAVGVCADPNVGKELVGMVGSAAPDGVTALDAVNAVGTCSGSLAERALVIISITVKRVDFIAICFYLPVSLYQINAHLTKKS